MSDFLTDEEQIIQLAHEGFIASRQNKIQAREQLLKEHPELRIQVDVDRLREIVNFEEFKCHPDSSIAHKRAVQGSDIDCGTVITNEEVPEDKRLEFIAELNSQGFRAADISEVRAAKRNDPYNSKLNSKLADALISFYTTSQIKNMEESDNYPSFAWWGLESTIKNGYRIKGIINK